MGRKKIDIKKISDEKTLLVTFAKRKVGLFNKAFELSELCECEVAILIFTNKNRMHMFASHDLGSVVKRYNDRPDRGELMTSKDIIERRKKKKQSKSSQVDDRSLNPRYPSNCDCANSEYDGTVDDESMVPTTGTTVPATTTAISASTNYNGQLTQLGLPQHSVGPHLKSFYPTDGVEEQADVFQHHAGDYDQRYAPECTVEAAEADSTLEMETDRLIAEESTKPLLIADLNIPSISSASNPLSKKLPKKRPNLGTLRTNRPPAFGDECKSFDPTISSPLPTSKRRNNATESELYTPEPHQKTTQVYISDGPDLYPGWNHVSAVPTSSSTAGRSLTKSTNVFNGNFTQLDESNQRHLITPDPEQLTTPPFP